MANVFVRTVILYILIMLLMRLAGKREVGQLELSELVTAFMVSELASIPITDNNIPLLYGIVPTVTLLCLEVFLSFIFIKSKTVKNLFSGAPLVVVENGIPKKRALTDARLSISELMSSIRQAGLSSISEVRYAILEPNGTMSIIPFAKERPASCSEACIDVEDKGIEHLLICDGKLNKTMIKKHNIKNSVLDKALRQNKCKSYKDVFYCGIDDLGNITVIKKDDTK